MSRSVRRSNSEQTNRRSSGNRNILSFNSDGDISNKRNSWWKNLPGNLRRNSSQLHPESLKVLNSSSTVEEQNSQWWKNLSVNERVSLPIKLRSIAEKGNRSNDGNDNLLEKNLSQDESGNENVSKNVFPKKSIFASQEQPSQKSRYSRAFNFNTEKEIEKKSQEQTKTELEEFINELEKNKITQSPTSNLTKAGKKKRRTKSIFSKRPIKRKYDDVFIDATETDETRNKDANKNQLILQEDPVDDMAEELEGKTKEKLFKLTLKKKKYSEAFFDEPAKQTLEKEESLEKIVDISNNQAEESTKEKEKVTLFKTNVKKKKYSEAFALSKSKLSQNSESDEEIQTQKDTSYISNRSINVTRGRKSSLHKTPTKQIQNEIKTVTPDRRNLRSTTPKRKESIVQPTKTDDSESSDNEIYIEEVISQKFSIETRKRKSLGPTGSKILQDNIENRVEENEEVDETKLDPSQNTKKSQIPHTETEKNESYDEKSIAQTTTKNVSQRKTRSKQYSEAILNHSNNKILHSDNDKSQIEKVVAESNENSVELPKTQKSLTQRKTRSRVNSEEFLGISTSSALQNNNNESQSGNEIDERNEKSMESPRTQKSLFPRNTRSKQYSEAFLGSVTSSALQNDNNKPHSVKEIKEHDETSFEEIRTQKGLFQRNTRSKQYSEAFLDFSANKSLQSNNNKSQSEKEIAQSVEKCIESPITKKGLFERNTRSKQNSEAFLVSSKSNTLKSDNNKSQKVTEIDGPAEKSIESPKTQKDLFQRNTRSKQYSEGFLGPSTSKSFPYNDKPQSEKETDNSDEKSLEQIRTQKDLFQRNTRSKQYSEAYLVPSTSKTSHSTNDKSQSKKELDEPENVQDKSRKFSQGIANLQADDENKENNQINKVLSQEILSTQRESLDQILSKNTKYSQAFLELLAMQKPIEEEHNNAPIIENVEHNKPDKEIVEKESVNDTQYSSISSINVSDEIKHPLFRPQARRSLYSTKTTGKVNEEEEKQSTHEPQQQQAIENNNSQKIKTKRISLRSTSPAESGISKFFDESLISSTKYFINSNEGTGSEESTKKKKRKSKKSSSDENNEKDNKHTPRLQTPSKKSRNSKLLSAINEHPDNVVTTENNLTKNKITEENIDVQLENKIKDKNLTLKKGKNFKLASTVREHSDNENQMVEENQEKNLEEQEKNKNSILKKGRKSKLIITSIVEVHREDGNDAPENIMNEDNGRSTEHTDPNQDQIGSSKSRRSNSVTRVSENSAQNKIENERTTDNTDAEPNKKLKKKRERPAKSTSTISENPQNITPSKHEIISDEKNIKETEKSLEKDELVNNRTRKSSVKTSEKVRIPTENEIEEDNNYKNIESEKSGINKKSSINKTRKSSVRSDGNSSIFNDAKDIETENILRKSFLVSKKAGLSVEKIQENKKIMEVHENRKDKRINSRMSRKSVFNVPDTLNQMSSDEEETDAVFIKKSLESIKSRKTQSYAQTSLVNKILEKKSEKSLQIESPIRLSSDSNNHKKLSSKSSIDRRSDSRAISGIITINSSLSRARSSQINKNTESWLSKSNITNNARFEENNNRNLQVSNVDPVFKNRKIIKDKFSPLSNEKEDLERQKILVNAAKNIGSKQKKLPPQVPDKKITDFFSKLEKGEKLKPIPKKVKKTVRPICTARLIDGKPYYTKKLFRGERWCSERFYKHIQNKIKNEYGDDTINESENVMRYIVSSVKTVIKSKKYLKKDVDDLKKELARHGIISTTYDFFCFCFEYLPIEYRDLVIPRTQCDTDEPNVPYNEKDTFKKIEF